MEKRANKHKIIYGKDLGSKLIELGFKTENIRKDRLKKGEFIYIFMNTYEIRQAIREILNK